MFDNILIGSLGIVSVVLCYKLIVVKLQIKHIYKQVEQLNNKVTRETIKVSLGDYDLERLAYCINNYIKNSESICNDTKRQEERLKQQISNISHDLRTPLTSINGYIQLLESKNLDEEKKMEYLRIIRNKSRNLNNLINYFFELSIIDSEEYAINIEKIDVTDLVYNTILSNYTIMNDKGIEPDVDIVHHAIYINSDVVVCERIVQNLITNALNHTDGTIYIKLKENSQGKAEFIISNEAKDLSEEDVSCLFDRFYTVDKSRTKGNTGLGLYIVKKLLDRINGKAFVTYKNKILEIKVVF